jgi:hypothetical protein
MNLKTGTRELFQRGEGGMGEDSNGDRTEKLKGRGLIGENSLKTICYTTGKNRGG